MPTPHGIRKVGLSMWPLSQAAGVFLFVTAGSMKAGPGDAKRGSVAERIWGRAPFLCWKCPGPSQGEDQSSRLGRSGGDEGAWLSRGV